MSIKGISSGSSSVKVLGHAPSRAPLKNTRKADRFLAQKKANVFSASTIKDHQQKRIIHLNDTDDAKRPWWSEALLKTLSVKSLKEDFKASLPIEAYTLGDILGAATLRVDHVQVDLLHEID